MSARVAFASSQSSLWVVNKANSKYNREKKSCSGDPSDGKHPSPRSSVCAFETSCSTLLIDESDQSDKLIHISALQSRK